MGVPLSLNYAQERAEAILSLLRGETSLQVLADRFDVPISEIQEWESVFIAGGSWSLTQAHDDNLPVADKAQSIDLAALHVISQSLAAILDVDDLVATTIDNLHWVFGYTPCIGLVDGPMLVLKGGYSIDGDRIDWQNRRLPVEDADRSMMVWVVANGRLLNVQDVANDPRYVPDVLVGSVRSELALPIIYKGRILGVLDIRDKDPNAFNQGDVSVLETVAIQLAIAIESAQLFEAVRRRVAQLELVQGVTAKAIENLEVESILGYTLQVIREILGYSSVAIGLIADDQRTLTIMTLTGSSKNFTAPTVLEVPIRDTTIFGAAIVSNRMILDNGIESGLESLNLQSRSRLAVPIRAKGVPIGVVNAESDLPHAFDDTDASTLTILADQLTISIQGARLFH